MKRLLPVTLAASTLLCGGCALWPFSHQKSAGAVPAPKQSRYISTEVELNFRQRWVEKRASDLVAQGMVPEAAHDQAMAEFRTKYAYTNAAKLP